MDTTKADGEQAERERRRGLKKYVENAIQQKGEFLFVPTDARKSRPHRFTIQRQDGSVCAVIGQKRSSPVVSARNLSPNCTV
jgi:hypothetical protein